VETKQLILVVLLLFICNNTDKISSYVSYRMTLFANALESELNLLCFPL